MFTKAQQPKNQQPKASIIAKNEKGWDVYLTDSDKYKMNKEKMSKKKELLISRHNILLNNTNIERTRLKKSKSTVPQSAAVNKWNVKPIFAKKSSQMSKSDVSSLDLITSNSVIEIGSQAQEKSRKSTAQKSVRAAQDIDMSPANTAHSPQPTRVVVERITTVEQAKEFELREMALQVKALYGEMRTFEQITGIRSVFEDCDEVCGLVCVSVFCTAVN